MPHADIGFKPAAQQSLKLPSKAGSVASGGFAKKRADGHDQKAGASHERHLPPLQSIQRPKRSGFEVQKAVIFALFLRELRTRFGKYQLGYLWALLEPGIHVLVLVSLFTFFLGRVKIGITFPVFFVAGIVPWFLFTNIAVRSLRAVSANSGLFNYKLLKPIDTVLARALLELLIYSLVYVVLLTAVWAMGEPVEILDFLRLVGSFFMVGWLATGIGLIFMVIGDAFTESEKLIPMFIQPLYFLSGIMISVSQIPSEYQGYLLWNPIFHAIEVGRGTLSASYDVAEVSLFYVFVCALVANVGGLWMYRVRERKMLSR